LALSKYETLSNSSKPNYYKNLSNGLDFSKYETVLSNRNRQKTLCLKPKLFQVAIKLTANVGSYTQVRTAGNFLSSRKAARAERCPPKTDAAELAGS
jgi:hypothetical protein